jgi:outer membrane protein
MKRYALFAALLIMMLTPLFAGAQSPSLKIAYVDLQKVMLESDRGKEARKSLVEELDKRKKELNQKQDDLQKMKDSLEKQSAAITPEARADKEKQYQIRLKDYQRMTTDYQTELQQKDQELTRNILKDLEELIKGMGEKEKYTFILEKTQGGLLFASPSMDITDKVITAYNEWAKQHKPAAPGAPKTPAPAAPKK